jgi:16S rRNA (cytosine1402-N4)-methyltransferase
MEIIHTSVMKQEVLSYLAPDGPDGLLVDCTLGEGGHTEAFLERYAGLRAVGLDADRAIMDRARERLSRFGARVRFENRWFDEYFRAYPQDLPRPDRILMDLGISSFHYESSGRGFSFQKDEPLDMRLSSGLETSAADIVNGSGESELADLIYEYGEERFSRRIARAVVERRKTGPIRTSAELADLVREAVPAQYRHGRIHPATKTFQALRIAVNGELDRLRSALSAAVGALAPGGLIGVITFHSLEDRIVKQFFRDKRKGCTCPPDAPICNCGGKPVLEAVTKKPVVPSEEETRTNPPSRSAKLRVSRKLRDEGEQR